MIRGTEITKTLVCDLCDYASPGERPTSLICRVLQVEVDPQSECRVTRQALITAAQKAEPLLDEIKDLEEAYGFQGLDSTWDEYFAHWYDDEEDEEYRAYDEYQRLRREVMNYPKIIRYLWPHMRTSRRCGRCGYLGLDSEERSCPTDGRPLLFNPKQRS